MEILGMWMMNMYKESKLPYITQIRWSQKLLDVRHTKYNYVSDSSAKNCTVTTYITHIFLNVSQVIPE